MLADVISAFVPVVLIFVVIPLISSIISKIAHGSIERNTSDHKKSCEKS